METESTGTPTGETQLALVRRARRINRILAETYPYAVAELDFETPFELLVATVLSAQTTDVRVNAATPALFARFPGFTDETDPVKVEHAVGALFPRRDWTMLSHRLIFHGRRVCHARRPACGACPIARWCPSYGEGETDPERARALLAYELKPGREELLELLRAGRTRRELRALGHGLEA